MLFFKFHIGDWESGTKLLTPTEKGVYLDLLLLYYSKEEAILRSYYERITKGYTDTERKAAEYVLSEFFVEGDDGRFHHKRCDEEIEAARAKSLKARESVMTRYRKKVTNVPTNVPTNVDETYNEATTNELLTINHKPLTTTLKKSNKRKATVEKPSEVDEQTWEDFLVLRKSKGAPLTQTALNGIAAEAAKAGLSLTIALQTMCQRGWQGFKAEWVQKEQSKLNGSRQPRDLEPDWNSMDYGKSGLIADM